MDITFTTTMYESPKINEIGVKLLQKYQILMDSLDFNPKFNMDEEDFYGNITSKYDSETGKLTNIRSSNKENVKNR